MSRPMEIAEAVKVQVVNADELRAVPTREIEPQHFTATSFPLPALGVGENAEANDPVQVLQLDPMRKLAYLTFNGDGQVWLAHSAAQAQALQNGVQQGADSGTLVTCPSVVKAEGTGPLWAVQATPTENPNSGSSLYIGGSGTPVAAFTTFGAITITPPAGQYQIYVSAYVDGTVVTADDEDNIRVSIAGVPTPFTGFLLIPAESSGPPIVVNYGPFTATLNGSQSVSMQTASKTPSGTAVYHGSILLNPVAGSTINDLIVGVLQSRRGA